MSTMALMALLEPEVALKVSLEERMRRWRAKSSLGLSLWAWSSPW